MTATWGPGPPQPPVPPSPWPAPWPAPPPPYPHREPEPYHRILCTWTYRPWRVLVGLLGTVAAGLLIGPAVALLLVGVSVQLLDVGSFAGVFDDLAALRITPAVLLVVNLSLALLIPITWTAVRLLHNLRPRWLGSVRPGLRWALLAQLAGFALAATVLAYGLFALLVPAAPVADTGAASTSTGTTVAFLVIILLTTPLQSAGEEYFFRGYLMQALGALVRAPWFALVLTSLLFALAHGTQNLPLFVDRFAFGLVAGILVLRSGGLEAGIAMHVVNNLVVLGIAAATGALTPTLGVSESSWLVLAVDGGQFLVYAALVLWWCRRRDVARRTTAAAPGP
ncbi:MAG: CPBP family intramembrane metalloprotease [Actinomycetota bacterium]|nr:CPBP family intramembrane metalloprotease [Actinomycetota bacterium]